MAPHPGISGQGGWTICRRATTRRKQIIANSRDMSRGYALLISFFGSGEVSDDMRCFCAVRGTKQQSNRNEMPVGAAQGMAASCATYGRISMRAGRYTRLNAIGAALAAGAMMALLPPAPAALAQDKTYVMKLATATINDTQHEWLKRFGAAVEKDSGGRIKAETD